MIRRYRPEDSGALAEIFHAAVHGTAAFFYSEAQCQAWSPAPDPERFADRDADGRYIFVALTAGEPSGFIELEQDGHIDCFYVHPNATTGTGARLYARLETQACEAAMPVLTVEASEPARRFFLKNGFADIARQQVERHGVTLHNYRMRKRLTQ